MELQGDDRAIEIGGEPLASILFLHAREGQQAQIIIDTCCDSVSIFDEKTVTDLILEMSLWLTRKRHGEEISALDNQPPKPVE
jgi:hypothetical protein